jgi:hypothetical protein
MNPLLSRLAGIRRKVRVLETWQGVCAVLTLIVGTVVVAGLLDWWVQLPSFFRGLVLVGIVGGSGWLAYQYLLRPMLSPCDNLTLALRIEDEFPELNDSLASTVQFLTEPTDTPGAASSSPTLRQKAIQVMTAKADQYDFGRIISYRAASILGVCLLAAVAVAGHFAYHYSQFSNIALWRLADPFGGHTWTTVEVPNAPRLIAVGQAFAVKAHLDGRIPEHAKVEIRLAKATSPEEAVDLPARPEEWDVRVQRETNSVFLPVDKTKYTKSFQFRVLANDGSFPPQPGRWHTVQVLPPPSLVDLDGQPSPQIAVYPPPYTEEKSPQQMAPGAKMIKAWAGSNIVFRAATDRPVVTAWFEYRPSTLTGISVAACRGTSVLGQLAALTPFAGLGDLFGGQTLWERVPAEIDIGGRSFTVRFTGWNPGTCVLHIEDEHGLPKEYTYELDVNLDPLPTVRLLQPATNLTLLPDAEVTFRFRADDEIFGLRSLFVEYQRGATDAPRGPRERVVLNLPDGFEKDLPQITAPLVAAPDAAVPPITPRQRRLEVSSLWKLDNQFKVGDLITLRVCADDYCDIYGSRTPASSHEVTLHIVSKTELAKVIDDKLKNIQQDVQKIRKMQKEAHDAVKEVEAKEKITEKDIERLVEAEQQQKAIQEQVGTPDDGLRKELDKLQQLLQDNKMKDSEAQMRTGMIKGALDQLARQELQQIEPSLAKARKEMQAQAHRDKKDDKQNKVQPKGKKDQKDDPLAKPARLQQNALKNLDELAQALNPWANMQDVKDEVRGILAEQKDIGKNLADLNNKKELLDDSNAPKEALKNEMDTLRDDLKKEGDRQEELAKRTESLQKKISEMQAQRQKDNDKENAQRLKDANRIADQADLPSKMKDTARELQRTSEDVNKDPVASNKAKQQLKKNSDNLEKMLSALDGKDDDATKQKLEKNARAQEKLDKLRKDMKNLEQKLDEINKLKDEEERLQKRKDIAKEFEKLKEQAQEDARELARLQEQRASKEVENAADELDKAADKLQQGQNPGDEQQAAQQDAKKAKDALQESQQELAREQLAKIADRLKGLMERQDAAIDRTKEFHRRLLAKKNWTDALGRSLDGDTNTQEGLAKEVRSLKEKIKEAKVFEHIMERSAVSMDEAVQTMKDRKADGLTDRQRDPKAGEPWTKDDLNEENKFNDSTLRHQKDAGQRLKRLMDAIKEELAKKPPEKKDDAQAKADGDQQPQQMRAADGIPEIAQLKALRSEQFDLNDRTEDFAKRHPNTNNLGDEQRRELERLEQDQRNLQELFQQMTANASKKGDAP